MLSLLSLNNSTLLNIWHHLLGDLPTHVALSQTCRTLRQLYGMDDGIWQATCFIAGYGKPLRRIPSGDDAGAIHALEWRTLACIVVGHAAVCEIGSCVRANACFAEHYTHLPYTRIRTLHPYHPVEFHPLYFYLHFNQSPHSTTNLRSHRRSISAHLPTPSPSPSPTPPPSIPDAVSIMLTHMPTFPECRYAQYGPLCSHPNASCAFATFPPVERLEFENGDGEVFMIVENSGGCTILDINRALAQLIPFDEYHIEVALGHYRELAMTFGMPLPQYASMITRERGFLDDHEYPFLNHIVTNM